MIVFWGVIKICIDVGETCSTFKVCYLVQVDAEVTACRMSVIYGGFRGFWPIRATEGEE